MYLSVFIRRLIGFLLLEHEIFETIFISYTLKGRKSIFRLLEGEIKTTQRRA